MITIEAMSCIGWSLFSPLYIFYLRLKISRAQYFISQNLFFHWRNDLSFLNISYFVKREKWYWLEGFRSGGGYICYNFVICITHGQHFYLCLKVKLFGKKQIERWAGPHFLCIDARLHLLYCISWPNYYTLLHTKM